MGGFKVHSTLHLV